MLDLADIANFRGKSLVLVKRTSPDFKAFTAKKGTHTLINVNAAIRAGNGLVKDNKIVDPALDISKSVTRGLRSRYALTIAGINRKVAEDDDLGTITKLGGSKDYVLDVATSDWGFTSNGFKFSEYLVTYSAKLRLIDVKESKVIAEGLCDYDWKAAGKEFVDYEQLLADDAAVIKQHLTESVKYCTKHYLTKLFGS